MFTVTFSGGETMYGGPEEARGKMLMSFGATEKKTIPQLVKGKYNFVNSSFSLCWWSFFV